MARIWMIALTLAGCATQNSAPILQTVEVPVIVPCVYDMPEKPQLTTDAEIKAMPDYQAVMELIINQIRRDIYILQLEATVQGCK